jgi:hypothetical protein
MFYLRGVPRFFQDLPLDGDKARTVPSGNRITAYFHP